MPYSFGDMEEADASAEGKLRAAAKAIGDLDDLVRALLTSLPPAKPWQRQLRQQLSDVDRCTQILRLTISLNRAGSEVSDAAEQLRSALRVAQRYVAVGRADLGTKAAVGLACELGQRIGAALE